MQESEITGTALTNNLSTSSTKIVCKAFASIYTCVQEKYMLANLKKLFTAGKISKIKLSRTLALPEYSQLLFELYPTVLIPNSAKFYMYLNSMPLSAVMCDGEHIKRFTGYNSGFQKYCGNQNSCRCNKQDKSVAWATISESDNQRRVQKRKDTNLKKYGFEFASQCPEVKIKSEETCIDRYGAKSPTMNVAVLQKSVNTCLKNNNVLYPQQNASILQKSEDTYMYRYGVTRPIQNSSIKQKMFDTNIDRYGGQNVMHSSDIAKKVVFTQKLARYADLINDRGNATALFSAEEYASSSRDDELAWQCKTCGTTFTQKLLPGKPPRCVSCNPLSETWGESRIRQWLDESGVEYEVNTRKIITPYELDFYIPSKNLAIEFNGIYWHSELAGRAKNYHYEKFKKCRDKGIKLIQIFEHELTFKESIVKSRVMYAIGKIDNQIGARKLSVAQLTYAEAKEFFDANHLQGSVPASATFALRNCSGEILSAMSFARTRFSKKLAEFELLRFATKLNCNVPGAAQKLFAYAVTMLGLTSVVSYADLKWGQGTLYEKLNFTLERISAPNYWYFRGINEVKSRLAFQKHKLPAELHSLGSEWDIMQLLGWNRFWDCGNAVWVWRNATAM